jgi:cation diffusion facilitator family transporter
MFFLLLRRLVPNWIQADDPDARQKAGMLSGGVGIVLNLLLFGGKLLAGLLTASIAVVADAFNNLSDAASSVVTLVGFRMAGQKADKDHPFGHGRIEYLAGLLVSLVILLVGFELLKSSIEKIFSPTPVDFSPLSLGILAVAILVKLWMYSINHRLGVHFSSAAMAATAADSLSDSIATGAVLVGSLLSHLLGISLDGFLGVVVALFILYTGFTSARDTLNPLLGTPPDPELVESIEQTVLSCPEITGMHDLVIHDYGPGRSMMSLHAEVPADCNLLHIHDVIDDLERTLNEKFCTVSVIHMDPIDTSDPRTQQLRQQMAKLVTGLDPDATIHDFRVTPGPCHTNLIFDVVLPNDLDLTDGQVREWIQNQTDWHLAEGKEGVFYTVVDIDHSYVK